MAPALPGAFDLAHLPLGDNEVLFDGCDDGRAIHVPPTHQGLFGCRAPFAGQAEPHYGGCAQTALQNL